MSDTEKKSNKDYKQPEGGGGELAKHNEIMDTILQEFTKKGGLAEMCQELKLDCKVPRKKITVLLLGNHSSGKSSFVNWYVGDSIQEVGQAQVTHGFNIISSGKIRDQYQANTAIRQLPYLASIAQNPDKLPGFLENLSMQISPSKNHNFPLGTSVRKVWAWHVHNCSATVTYM